MPNHRVTGNVKMLHLRGHQEQLNAEACKDVGSLGLVAKSQNVKYIFKKQNLNLSNVSPIVTILSTQATQFISGACQGKGCASH